MSCRLKLWETKSSFDVEAADWMLSNEFVEVVEFLIALVIVVFFMRKKNGSRARGSNTM